MNPTTEALLQTALMLSPTEQIELIEALIAAIDQAHPQPLDNSWLAEIRRRSAEYDAGMVIPIAWSVVNARTESGDHTGG